jgi:hypothetical protein
MPKIPFVSIHGDLPQCEWDPGPAWGDVLVALAARGLSVTLSPGGILRATPAERVDSETREFLTEHRWWLRRLVILDPEQQHQLVLVDYRLKLWLMSSRYQRLRLRFGEGSPLSESSHAALSRTLAAYEAFAATDRRPNLLAAENLLGPEAPHA